MLKTEEPSLELFNNLLVKSHKKEQKFCSFFIDKNQVKTLKLCKNL